MRMPPEYTRPTARCANASQTSTVRGAYDEQPNPFRRGCRDNFGEVFCPRSFPPPAWEIELSSADRRTANQLQAATRASPSAAQRTSATQAAAVELDGHGSPQQQEVTRVWRMLDTRDTGLLDWEQTQELMRRLGRRPETLDMKAVFDEMDPSCHGEVAFQDFIRWWDGQRAEVQQQLQQLESLHL